jgi:hypothetical protein
VAVERVAAVVDSVGAVIVVDSTSMGSDYTHIMWPDPSVILSVTDDTQATYAV